MSEPFVAQLPLWFLVHRSGVAIDRDGSATFADPLRLLIVDGGDKTCLPLFTDENLANRFARNADMPSVAACLETREQAIDLLENRRPLEVNSVVFDPARLGRVRWTVPLAEVVRAFRD